MATKNIVDTHALIWYLEGNPRLGANAKTVLDEPTSELVIPLMHDRQIVATALCLADQGETVAVLSKDRNIQASGLAPIIW